MDNELEDWLIGEIESLPPLPKTVLELERTMSDPASTASDVAEIIEKDSMLTADLLKLINSSFIYLKHEITSVAQIVSLLGRNTVKDYAVAISIRRCFEIDMAPYGLSLNEQSELASKRAFLARSVAEHMFDQSTRERVFLPALLLDIGRVLIAKRIAGDGKSDAFLGFAKDNGMDFKMAEKAFVGHLAEEISCKMLEKWEIYGHIPKSIIYSTKPHKSEEEIKPLALTLCAANMGIELLAGIADPSEVKQRSSSLGMDPDTLLKLIGSSDI